MAYLELDKVSYSYPNGYQALREVSLSCELGEAVAIIGRNGAGKTTMVKLMNGLLKPTHGRVMVDGTATDQEDAAHVAAKVGYVFQNPDDQIFQDSIRREIAYGLVKKHVARERIGGRVAWAAEVCGLEDSLDSHPYDLPFSQRKFVTIASALVMDPQVLILDEPTAGQDRAATDLLAGIIQQVTAMGKTVVTISHDMEFVTRHFQRGIVMADRQILMDGPIARIFRDDDLLEQAHLARPYLAQLAQAWGFHDVLTSEDFMAALPQTSLLTNR